MATLPPIHPNQTARTSNIAGVTVREDLLFTDAKGAEKPALRTEVEKAIGKMGNVLPRLLEPGETVFYIVQAVAPLTFFEQFTLGWYALQLKGVTLVLTDRRLLRFRRKTKGLRDWEWTRGVQSVRWGDVAEATVKGWLARVLTLKYRSGRKEVYRLAGIGPGKKVGMLIPALVPPGTGGAGSPTGQDMASLCPECVKPLTPQNYQCGSCGLNFKNEKTLLWRNFLVPGGGFFYTGWTGLGILQLLPDVGLGIGFLSMVLIAMRVLPPPAPDPGQAAMGASDAAILAVIFLGALFLENLVSWYHTRRLVRDFIPER